MGMDRVYNRGEVSYSQQTFTSDPPTVDNNLPVAPGRCFCRRGGAFWSFGEETPRTPAQMWQICPLTYYHWTASCGSRKEYHNIYVNSIPIQPPLITPIITHQHLQRPEAARL